MSHRPVGQGIAPSPVPFKCPGKPAACFTFRTVAFQAHPGHAGVWESDLTEEGRGITIEGNQEWFRIEPKSSFSHS